MYLNVFPGLAADDKRRLQTAATIHDVASLFDSAMDRGMHATGQTFPGAGTITGLTAGSGLTGGGKSGNVNVGLTGACAKGQVLQWNGSAWGCAAVSAGTITGVTAGAGLSGGGTSGNVTVTNTGVLTVAGNGHYVERRERAGSQSEYRLYGWALSPTGGRHA
jgi:hypothetical protein